MRLTVLTVVLIIACGPLAFGQPAIELGPIVRADRVFIEGGAGGTTAILGVRGDVWFTKNLGLEAEITQATGTFERSYEGWFLSYAEPGATREQIERMAPTARRTLRYSPGTGLAVAFVARGALSPRVALAAQVGVSGRAYDETSIFTILTVPDGIDPTQAAKSLPEESSSRTRGGLLFGTVMNVAASKNLNVAPELRFVYGGPARVGNNYRELGVGVRAAWRF